MRGEPFGDGFCIVAMALHAERQRLDAGQNQKRIERRQRRAEIAQAEHAARDRKREVAERLLQFDAVIFRARFAERRIFVAGRPVERAGVDDDAADRIAVTAEKLRQRMHDDVSTMIDRANQIRRCQRIIDDKRHAGFSCDGGDRFDVGDGAAGIGDRFDEDRFSFRRDGFFEAADVVGVRPDNVPTERFEGVGELVDRAAIEFARGDEFVTGLQQLLKHHHLRGMAGRHRQRGRTAFERCDALFQHRIGRVADARVDVAERLQSEQRCGVISIVEHEGCGLIDRRRACARGRVRLRAGVNGECGKAGLAVGHGFVPDMMKELNCRAC